MPSPSPAGRHAEPLAGHTPPRQLRVPSFAFGMTGASVPLDAAASSAVSFFCSPSVALSRRPGVSWVRGHTMHEIRSLSPPGFQSLRTLAPLSALSSLRGFSPGAMYHTPLPWQPAATRGGLHRELLGCLAVTEAKFEVADTNKSRSVTSGRRCTPGVNGIGHATSRSNRTSSRACFEGPEAVARIRCLHLDGQISEDRGVCQLSV